jgi:LAS superfamily LD-carboxypeptidase LdcB
VLSANLVGQSDTHLCGPSDAALVGARMHREAIGPYLELRTAAHVAGFDLSVLSGFRSFEEQLSIWNRKASGKLAVLGSDARPLDITTLSDRELVFAILRWSALPGASRHHWGTDVDIYDMAARPVGYEIQLVPAEVDSGGMFAPLHEWLDRRIANKTASGFFRPYDIDRNGVAPERWHLSFAPVALESARMLTRELLAQTVEQADMLHKDIVLEHLDAIFDRFVINVNRSVGRA